LHHESDEKHTQIGGPIPGFPALRVGHAASPQLEVTLKDHVRNPLGAICVLAEISVVERLPKTRSGKIMRRLLKAQELGQ